MKWFLFAVRNTLRNRRRSAVTVMIAALGCTGILLAGGFALFTYQGLEQAAARETGHLIVATPAFFDKEEDTAMQYGMDGFEAVKAKLLQDPDVRYVLPRVNFSGLISNGDKSVIMIGSGIDPDAEFAVRGPFITVKSGTTLSADSAKGTPEILIGADLAKQLHAQPGTGLTLMATTSEGTLNAQDVIVKGVVSTGVPDIDKRLVFTHIRAAQRLLVTERVSTVGVYLRNMEATVGAQARVKAALAGMAVRTWLDQAVFFQSVKALYDRIFGALGMVIGIIVIFVVANAMAMAIVERTREIGTLRAMGTLPGQLVRVFAMEGFVLGGTGAAVGALVAASVAVVLMFADIQMPPPPGRSVGYPLYVNLSVPLYLGTFVGIALLATVAAALVGRKAANKPVVDALNHV